MKTIFQLAFRIAIKVEDFTSPAVFYSLLLFLSVFIRVHPWFQGFSPCA